MCVCAGDCVCVCVCLCVCVFVCLCAFDVHVYCEAFQSRESTLCGVRESTLCGIPESTMCGGPSRVHAVWHSRFQSPRCVAPRRESTLCGIPEATMCGAFSRVHTVWHSRAHLCGASAGVCARLCPCAIVWHRHHVIRFVRLPLSISCLCLEGFGVGCRGGGGLGCVGWAWLVGRGFVPARPHLCRHTHYCVSVRVRVCVLLCVGGECDARGCMCSRELFVCAYVW